MKPTLTAEEIALGAWLGAHLEKVRDSETGEIVDVKLAWPVSLTRCEVCGWPVAACRCPSRVSNEAKR